MHAGFFTGGSLVCSVHPSGAISVAPQARPGLEATAFPTMLLAVPLTIASLLALGIARKLGVETPGAPDTSSEAGPAPTS